MERENSKTYLDVSIVIVNYNSFKLLENCLKTLYEYTKQVKFEVIIIDNNSTEGNIKDILNDRIYDNLILIQNNDNKGFGYANNQGITVAKGKYVLFLNNDTIFFENTVKKIFDFSESMKKPVIVGCKLLNSDKTVQKSVFDFPSVLNVFTSNFFLYLLFPKSKYFNKYHFINRQINTVSKVDVVTGAFLFCRLDAIKELRGFDEDFFFYNEETDLCYRFVKSGGDVYYFPETSIIHLKGGTAKKTSWFSYMNQSISTIKFFQKHFTKPQLIFTLIVHYLGILIRIPVFFITGLVRLNQDLVKRSLYNFRLLFVYPMNNFKG